MELVSKEECHILKVHNYTLQIRVRDERLLLDNVAAAAAAGRGSGGVHKTVVILVLAFGWRKLYSIVRKSSRRSNGLHFTSRHSILATVCC
jgi:hypothetical protein